MFQENQTDIVRALLLAGADPCVQNQEQKTPLDLTSSPKVQNVFNDQLLQCIAKSRYSAHYRSNLGDLYAYMLYMF